jgi:DNA relaxase NicK
VSERSLLGFDGISAGNNFVGVNHERVYLQLSSHHADEYIAVIDREDLHYSRIDVQATVWFTVEQTNIAKEAFNELSNRGERVPRPGNRSFRIIIGSDGGDTCYVGSPSSRQQARIYNKARQTEKAHYAGAWRHEIVLRDTLAGAYAILRRSPTFNSPDGHLAYVYNWFAERALCYDYLSDHGRLVLPKRKSQPSDVDTKLRWLERQVKPAIEFLTERGFRDSVITALGL